MDKDRDSKRKVLSTAQDRRSARRLLLLGPSLVGTVILLAALLSWCSAR